MADYLYLAFVFVVVCAAVALVFAAQRDVDAKWRAFFEKWDRLGDRNGSRKD